ncbi:GCN5-related N-acetyltransferase 9-like isoform X3 [Primulina tabacum]|uniref:GCN5-related N-acetyltransferase 9-like isoform X3 n=1 Tax=Primulina tabacum TaxID=48773 RepID=UPI003F5908CC
MTVFSASRHKIENEAELGWRKSDTGTIHERPCAQVPCVGMQDPGILQATASEPLTLDQEYEMQLSWSQDTLKHTFIVLDKELIVGDFIHGQPYTQAMVGDVNIFMNDLDDSHIAEIEIMIAENKRNSRRFHIVRFSKRLPWNYGLQSKELHQLISSTVSHS